MGPIGRILPTKGELLIMVFIIMLLGWCAVEFILWLLSFFEISLAK